MLYQENGNIHADPGIHFPAGFSDDATDDFIAELGVGKLADPAIPLVFCLRRRVFSGSGPGGESDLGIDTRNNLACHAFFRLANPLSCVMHGMALSDCGCFVFWFSLVKGADADDFRPIFQTLRGILSADDSFRRRVENRAG